jgi:hypothetical protein
MVTAEPTLMGTKRAQFLKSGNPNSRRCMGASIAIQTWECCLARAGADRGNSSRRTTSKNFSLAGNRRIASGASEFYAQEWSELTKRSDCAGRPSAPCGCRGYFRRDGEPCFTGSRLK